MDIAIYGGSFNPPHMGHALVASWLGWTLKVDQVWLLPTFDHAFGKNLAPWKTRLGWCEAMAQAVPGDVYVCPIEQELPSPSYTIDTLTALAARYPQHRFRLVIGSDNLEVLDKWKAWDRISGGFSPIVVGRTGYEIPADSLAFPEVSPTEIRRRLVAGESVEHLVLAAGLDGIEPGVFG